MLCKIPKSAKAFHRDGVSILSSKAALPGADWNGLACGRF
jgi:hypothetical protein